MKKFTASELIKRATQLADIENTDFLNHEELTNYINEAWRTVYQWLINKGDKQFINEVQLSGNGYNGYLEYELPDDLYQILSIRTPTGEIIGRKAESESDNSNTYEVVNDRLRLYGTASNLILTYYTVPIWITFPDRTIPLDLDADIVSTCKSSALLSDGTIRNLITGETLGSVDISLGNWMLGNGHLVCDKYLGDTGSNPLYYDFSGNAILERYTYGLDNIMKDYDGNLVADGDFMKHEWKGGIRAYYKDLGFDDATIDYILRYNIWFLGKHFVLGQAGTNNFNGFAVYTPNGKTNVTFYDSTYGETSNFNFVNRFTPIDKNHVFIQDPIKGGFMLEVTDDYEITLTQITDTEYPIIIAGLKDYFITSNGSYIQLESNAEDTEFNFPNELYVQLLAADLGLRFLFKMNADSSGLNNQYEAMRTAFMNSLTQDGNYTRITNYYRS